MRKNVAFDIDGVLVKCIALQYIEYLQYKHGIDGVLERYLETYNWETAVQCSSDKTSDLYHEFEHSPYCPPLTVLPGVRPNLIGLADYFLLHTATARPKSLQERTLGVLTEHLLDDPFESHCFGAVPDKEIFIRRLNADVLVEDNYRQARLVAEKTDAVVLFFPSPLNAHLPRVSTKKLIFLEAGKHAEREMPPEEWDKVHESAWRETASLVPECMRVR